MSQQLEPTTVAIAHTKHADVSYGTTAAHRLDVYRPESTETTPTGGAPILVVVHGGAWQYGDKATPAVVDNKVAHWVPRGYVVVSVNYRLDPPDPIQQAEDVAQALAFVQTHAADWGGDGERVVLLGHSSGAHLVSLLAADRSIAADHGARPWLGTVALDSAAFDVERIMKRRHFRFYDRAFRDDEQYWRLASPLHRLGEAPDPMFIVCSSERRASCPQARAFMAKARTLGGRVTVLPVSLSHRDTNIQLGTEGPYTAAVDDFFQSLGLP
ncbi:MAG: alpha/beta hydrolase [Myxococcota bacterium]